MAKLQAVLDEQNFNSIEDESLKSFYVQNSETKQYFLDVDGADNLAFNLRDSLKKKEDLLKKAHDEKRELAEKTKAFESLGKTPEEIKQILESNRPEEINKLIEKYEHEKNSLKSSFEESLTSEKTARERYQQQALSMALNAKIAQVRKDFDLNDTADFVLRSYIKAEEDENGKVVTRIYGEDGQLMLKALQPITEEQFLNDLKEQKKYLSMFNAPNGGGTGATNRQSSVGNKPKTATKEQLKAMSPDEKREFYLNGGEQI